MKIPGIPGAIRSECPRPLAHTGASTRVAFLDNLRYLMVGFVLVYHSCGAYATVAPHWVVHDTSSLTADTIRELLDVFMMPVLFFIAGYFALASLQKKGAKEFFKEKVKRLLIPWALAVLIFLPLVIYDQPINPVRPFWKYWLWYLSSFETRLRFAQSPVGLTTQAIYWFISLLFAFFLLFALVFALTHRQRRSKILPAERKVRSGNSMLVALVIFGLLTSVGYFILLLLFPDSSWFTLQMFLEFQVTRLVPYAAYFAFGVYAQSRGWFTDGKSLGSLVLWGPISAVLAVAYLVVGQPVFANTTGTANLSVGFLLVFAFLRSFLLLSLLVVSRLSRRPLLEPGKRLGPATFGDILQYLSHPLLVRGGDSSGTVDLGGRAGADQGRNRFYWRARAELRDQPMATCLPFARICIGNLSLVRALSCHPPVS